MKKTGLSETVRFSSVDFNPIDTNNILDIYKYLKRRTWYKIMLKLIKKIFIGLLTGIVNGCNHKMCFSLSNQKCKIQPILINYILMNTVKNFTIIHFQLNYINVFEVVILWMIYLKKHIFQIKQKIQILACSTRLPE